MSTTSIPSGQPTIPLTPDALAAYKALYDQYETSIEATADPALIDSLFTSQQAVADVLRLNDAYILAQDTAAFQAILKQLNSTNKGLDDLQKQIKKIAGDIKMYAGILGGITKVLGMMPGL